MKKLKFTWMALIVMGLFVACERDIVNNIDDDDDDDVDVEEVDDDKDEEGEDDDEGEDDNDEIDTSGNVVDHDADSDYVWDGSDVTAIVLNGSSITVEGEGAEVNGSVVTITAGGNYDVSGSLSDGQVVVNSEDESIVRLILNGADISCSDNAPVYVEQAQKAMIVLAEGTQNKVSDGSSYNSGEEYANAAIFSKDDLTICGDGALAVNGNYNDGIAGKDGLIIAGGSITVHSVDDGIRGKDYLVIKGGDIVVDAEDDGLKSNNDENAAKGYIYISGGEIDISSGGDGIQAETDVLISKATIDVYSGGGSGGYLGYDESAKGIKSTVCTVIGSGTITIDAADDAIHSDGSLEISGGTLDLASGDDGVHAENDLLVESGDIVISESYEGLESASGSITINGGDIYIVASDDGINVAAGGDSGGGQRRSVSGTSGTCALNINGGYVYVNSSGDGLDSNDNINITGGTTLVNGPTSNSNGPLDYDGSCSVSGGFLLAVGSSGMAQAPGSSSSQYSVAITFRSTIYSGNIIHVEDEDGNDIMTFKTSKSCQSAVLSSPDLENGKTYKVYTGGSSTGTNADGLYSGGTYSGGSLYASFTISGKVTTVRY